MTTSGTTAFTLDFTDLAELAWANAGKEMRSGWELRLARMSMNLMTIEWANRGLNMWTFEEGAINLQKGVYDYDLPADTIDLLDHVVRTGGGSASTQADVAITRISVSTYATIPNKLAPGRPIQLYVQRLRDTPKVTVWPVPDQDNTYVLKYWRLRRVQDAGTGVETPDVQFRFYPALVAGLAYYIAMKVPELADRLPMLKQEYETQYDLAAGEDREKAAVRFVPRMIGI